MNTKTDEGKRMEGNLTKGPILKTLTKLAIPIMASSFLGTLYNICLLYTSDAADE